MRIRRTEPVETGIAAECSAFLSGGYADYLVTFGRPVPVWAWVNLLAHGTAEMLRSNAETVDIARMTHPSGDWNEACCYLAGEVLHAVDSGLVSLHRLQMETLIPLETLLASGQVTVDRPPRLVSTVLNTLRENGYWPQAA